MAVPVTRIINMGGWSGGGGGRSCSCCLICLGAVPPEGVAEGGQGGKSFDTFAKVCGFFNISFNDVRGDWNFGDGGGGSEKLPFCGVCLGAIQTVIGLQEELESIQRRIASGVASLLEKIRETSSGTTFITVGSGGDVFQRVHNFRSKAIAAVTSSSCGSSTSSPTTINPTAPIPQTWISPQQQEQQLYPTSSSVSPAQPIYVCPLPTQPEPFTPPPSINFTVTHSGFRVTSGTGATATVFDMGSETTSLPPPPNDEYFNEGFETEEVITSEETLHTADTSPPKRPKKSRSQKSSAKPPQKTGFSKTPQKSRGGGGSRQNEYFAPVQTDPHGKMLFEGIVITPISSGGYQCGLCSATCGKAHDSIGLRKIKIHIKGFHLGAYKCHLCDKNFTSNDILSQHITRTHEVGDRPCDVCQKPIRPRYMLLHKYTHMNAEEKAALVATGFKPPISSFDKEKRFPCPRCGAMFKKMTNLRIHERTHMDEKTRPRHKCEHCDKSYTNTQSLKEHTLRAHMDGTIIKAELRRREICKICGKTVFSRIMARHMKTHVATENRPFACKVCGKRFQDEKILKNHEEKLHKEGETPDQLPFECDICGKRSGTAKQMRSHRRRVHKDNWKAKIPAAMVGDVTVDNPSDDFMLLEDLNNEGLQHVEKNIYSFHLYQVEKLSGKSTGFKCLTCFKEFLGEEGDKLEEIVKAHMRDQHIGNFRCNLCTKRMKNVTEVIAHKKIEHLNTDSFNCAVCLKPGIPRKSIRGHQFSHRGVFEVADAINQGIYLPGKGTVNRGDKGLEEREEILRAFGERLCYMCALCGNKFDKLVDLDSHRRGEHQSGQKMAKEEETEAKSEGGLRGLRRSLRKRKVKRGSEIEESSSSGGEKKWKRGAKREEHGVDGKLCPEYVIKVEMESDDATDIEEEEVGAEEIADHEESDPDFKIDGKAKKHMCSKTGRASKNEDVIARETEGIPVTCNTGNGKPTSSCHQKRDGIRVDVKPERIEEEEEEEDTLNINETMKMDIKGSPQSADATSDED